MGGTFLRLEVVRFLLGVPWECLRVIHIQGSQNQVSLNSVSHWTVSGSWMICSCDRGGSNLQGSVSIDGLSLVGTSDTDEVASSFVTTETID